MPAALSLLAAGALSACASVQPVESIASAVVAARAGTAEVESLPVRRYAQMRLRVAGRGEAIMLLARLQHGVQEWMAVDGKRIFIDTSGALVATDGFPGDLTLHQWLEVPPDFSRMLEDGGEHRTARLVGSVDDPGLYTVRARYVLLGEVQPMRYGGNTVPVRRIVEHMELVETGASDRNEYWVHAATGAVIVARQRAYPGALEFRMEAVPVPD